MAILTRTVVEATCDKCQEAIDTSGRYVDASVYGAAFHNECWAGIGGPVVARLLGLDEIEWKQNGRDLGRAWSPK